MELVQKHIHRNRMKSRGVAQMMLDDDFNVPDSKPDALRIISGNARIDLEQKKVLTGRLVLSGILDFCVLYAAGEEENKIQSLKGRIPFEETVNMENLEERDEVEVRSQLENLQLSLINSRKISIKALVRFTAEATELYDEELATEIEGGDHVYTKKEMVQTLQLLTQKKDTFRIKEELTLENGRPNIYEMLWEDAGFKKMEIRPQEDRLVLQGEMEVFFLYAGEEEGHGLQWVTRTFPVQGEVPCQGAGEEAICNVQWNPEYFELTVAPDYDGEERVVHIEGILGLNIQLFKEEEIPMLVDAYSTAQELSLKKEPGTWEKLLLNNESRLRLSEKLNRPENKAKILQSCYGQATAQIGQVKQTEDVVEISGTVMVSALYVTAQEEIPLDALKEQIPFSLQVQVPESGQECRIFVHCQVNDLELSMNSTDQLEVKIELLLHTMVVCRPDVDCVVSMEVQELDMEKLQELPGMVGLMVQNGDSLWEIAKENHTTVEKIRELNQLSTEELHKGQKLVILKAIL